MGPDQTKSFCTAKETINKNKNTTYRMGKNIGKWCNQQELMTKIYKQCIELRKKKAGVGAKYLNRCFSKEGIQMAKRHMKRCSTSLIITEMQITASMKYHFIPVRMAIIKKSTNNKCQRGYGETGTFLHCWWESQLIQQPWRGIRVCVCVLSCFSCVWLCVINGRHLARLFVHGIL